MFFRRIKSDLSDASSPKVPSVQKIIGLTLTLVVVWFVFAAESPLNRNAQKQVQPGPVQQPAADAPAGGASSPATPSARVKALSPTVASTSPAITDSLVALGLADHLVGRSSYCRSAAQSLPVVGDLRAFDAERLALAAPDVLFVQPPLAGVDPALSAFCEAKSIRLVARRLDSLADVDALVDDIAAVFGATPNVGGSPLERALGSAKASIAAGTRASEGARRVLLLVSTDPFLAVGEGTYLDELLGGVDLANALGRRGYVELSAEALVALSPPIVIGITETEEGARRMRDALRALPWPADARPKVAVDAVPALLSPSLVAVATRTELIRLAEAATW